MAKPVSFLVRGDEGLLMWVQDPMEFKIQEATLKVLDF